MPVLVPRAEIAAQARPEAWHGHGTGPVGHGPDRIRAVLFWAGPVPARRARPSWPTIPRTYADCVHRCLPGLQDTWNELLYSKLFYP